MIIDIKISFDDFDAIYKELDQLFDRVIKELINVGEEYIADGKTSGTYTDQTGNLRGAHSYIIYYNGERVAGVIGRPETLEMFESMKESEGLQFIVGNGMYYASFVEGKGFNVSTSAFMKVERRVRGIFKL